MEDIMKVKMKVDVKGAAGNGETTILYKAGQTYEMKTDLEMQMAGAWTNDGRAEQATANMQKKVIKEEKKAESKVKKVAKKLFGKKKK
jgi:adenylate kinase|tara:strand:- start:262 stop:525 length:264 start_codon:yes stop_codon:yes gene_type:complete